MLADEDRSGDFSCRFFLEGKCEITNGDKRRGICRRSPFVFAVIAYFVKTISKNSLMSVHDFLSAFSLYAIGMLNFLPVSVAAGFVKA